MDFSSAFWTCHLNSTSNQPFCSTTMHLTIRTILNQFNLLVIVECCCCCLVTDQPSLDRHIIRLFQPCPSHPGMHFGLHICSIDSVYFLWSFIITGSFFRSLSLSLSLSLSFPSLLSLFFLSLYLLSRLLSFLFIS